MARERQITRREFKRGIALVATSGFISIQAAVSGSRPALALSHLDWIVTDAEIISADGSISELTFGDSEERENDAIQVSYEGLNNLPTEIVFEIWLRGTNEGRGGWSGGNNETNWERLATGRTEVDQPTNEETYLWEEIFGEPTPVNVADHSEIALEDFEVPQEGTTAQQVLEVELRAIVLEEDDISATVTSTATISVTNATVTPSLNLYYNSSTPTTVLSPAGNSANNNQGVARWLPREESIEAIEMREGIRPTYQTTAIGTPARPAIEFNRTQHLLTKAANGTNLGTNIRRDNTKQATIFCVFQPRSSTTTGDREVIRLHQNDANTIWYRRNPGRITGILQGVQRTIELTTPANTTSLLSLLFRRDGNNVLLEARRNGTQVGSTQNFGEVLLPDQPVVRIGSPNNAAGFNMLFAALRIYYTDQGSNISEIEAAMMNAWDIN